MTSYPTTHDQNMEEEQEDVDLLHPDEADEEIVQDEDAPMESDDDDADAAAGGPVAEIQLQNDSIAHFDGHRDSIFCIAQHPNHPEIVATGAGDDCGYIIDSALTNNGPLPTSFESSIQPAGRKSLPSLFKLEGHTDSVNAVTFTLPKGEYVISAGLDGRLRAWQGDESGRQWKFVAESQEVQEINWISPCPHPDHPNIVSFGANDGSVWVYTINAADSASPLTILQAFYLHTESCTAGAWTPDGKLLATVSEDSSFYVWDVFGEAAAAGLQQAQGGQSLVGLTAQDERFKVDGGLYSVAVAPNGAFAAVGGAGGHIRVVGLPILATDERTTAGSRAKPGSAKNKGASKGGTKASSGGQAGQILASLQAQGDGVETLSFSAPPLTLMAAGSVDGSIALFDTAHRFAVRRHIRDAHEEEAVIKVEFVTNNPTAAWLLTSCGNDGVVRRWDTRGGTAASAHGLIGEWKGHRGGGEGGGVLGFVQGGGGQRIITAGDE